MGLFLISAAITSCKRGGDSPPSALPEPSTSATFTQVYSIFNGAGCLTSGCHGASAAPLMNSQSTAYSNMVGKTSNCSGKTYVVSGNSLGSYLVEKIASNPSCGSRMPQGNASYFDSNSSQLQTVKDWINDGAQNN